MSVFILRRLLQAIPTLWLIATLTFVLMKLTPGGPFDDEKPVSPEVRYLIEAHYGLDQPVYHHYIFVSSQPPIPLVLKPGATRKLRFGLRPRFAACAQRGR